MLKSYVIVIIALLCCWDILCYVCFLIMNSHWNFISFIGPLCGKGLLRRPDVMWGLLSQFFPFHYFCNFSIYKNTGYLWYIMFIFGRCRCSLAAATSVKYGCDLKTLHVFLQDRKFANREINKHSFCNPHPWSAQHHWSVMWCCDIISWPDSGWLACVKLAELPLWCWGNTIWHVTVIGTVGSLE